MYPAQVQELKKLTLYSAATGSFHRLSDEELADAADIVRQDPKVSVQRLLHAVVSRPEPQYQIDRI